MRRLKRDVFKQLAEAVDTSRLQVAPGTPMGQAVSAALALQREAIARSIADVLADHSPKFNMITFLNDCGFKHNG